jgi:hypothetical protein
MATRLFATLLILILTANSAVTQVRNKAAEMVRRYEVGGSGSDEIMEATTTLAHYFNVKLADKTIVRLCSKKSLRIAIATAAADPVVISRRLFYNYSIPFDQTIISRSEDCLGQLKTTTATELWAVSNNAPLPPAVESIKSCQIKVQYIKSDVKNRTEVPVRRTYDHKKSIEKLISELQDNPHAVGIVIGYYLKKPNRKLKVKLQTAQRMLVQSGLPSGRFFIQLMPWTGYYDLYPKEPEPEYLSVALVDIVPQCLQLSRSDEIIVAE